MRNRFSPVGTWIFLLLAGCSGGGGTAGPGQPKDWIYFAAESLADSRGTINRVHPDGSALEIVKVCDYQCGGVRYAAQAGRLYYPDGLNHGPTTWHIIRPDGTDSIGPIVLPFIDMELRSDAQAFTGTFANGADTGIGITAADGTGFSQLTDGSLDDRMPVWSLTGNAIAFQRRVGDSLEVAIIMGAHGESPHAVMPDSLASRPGTLSYAFTRDGTGLIFTRFFNPDTLNGVWFVSTAGTGLRRLSKLFCEGAYQWTTDGSSFICLGGGVVNRFALDGSASETVSPDGNNYALFLEADDRTAVTNHDIGIDLLDLETKSQVDVPGLSGEIQGPSVALPASAH